MDTEKLVYPRMVYHRERGHKVVQSVEELTALGDGWGQKPHPVVDSASATDPVADLASAVKDLADRVAALEAAQEKKPRKN
jgi:hypothetical protein